MIAEKHKPFVPLWDRIRSYLQQWLHGVCVCAERHSLLFYSFWDRLCSC